MKKILAWVLVLVMVLGMFAGCKKEEAPATEPAGEVITAQDAIEYLKALYPKSEDAMKTPVNYDRLGIIRIGGIPFNVVWTTDLSEDKIKVIVSEDGATVTIDVNEQCEMDTPYVLTATITDEQGNTASTTWNCLLPQAVDMVSLVKEAYALKSGESLPYQVTLTGKVVSIDTVFNPEYNNITVTIAVEGAEDMPIQCYRLKGEGIDKLAVGNIITVTGTLKNYNGTIEFDAGCMMDAWELGDAVEAPTDPGEILKAAYKLKKGKALPYPATLTGKVTSIDKPFDPAYNNISVVITVEGYEKYPILCYRLKGTGAEDIAIEDTITVTGIIKNYEGTIEYDAGCMLIDRISGGNTAQKPSDDEAQILKDLKKLKDGEKLPYVAILTGQVFSVDEKYTTEYKNVTVTMKVNGVRIKAYRMKGDGVEKVKVGDTITVSGQMENYGGVIEFSSGCAMTDRKAGNGKLKVELGPVENGKTYYAEMFQGSLNKNLYFNGKISGSSYLQTTENPAQAVKISVEETSGKGTRFYFMNGETKTYIEIMTNPEGKQRTTLVTEPTGYWNYDSEYKVYFFDADGVYCALGTYSTNDSISATKLGFLSTSNIGKTQFVVKFVEEPSAAPEQPDTPVAGITFVDAPAVGTAYKFVLDQAGLGEQLGFMGSMSGYYFATSTEISQMVDVYLEEATGGYYIYFMNGSNKTYLNVVPRDGQAGKVNVKMQTLAENAAPSVYTLNTEFKYVKTSCEGNEWYLGTYGTNRTISASATSYISDTSTIGATQFITWFATAGEGGGTTPDTPVVPDQPTTPEQPVGVTELKTGDQVVIFAPAYNKALSTEIVAQYYQAGIDVTVANGAVTGYGASSTWTVTVNADGSYSFANGGQNIALASSYSSMKLGEVNDDWTLESLGGTLYNIKNVVRGNYMEWYAEKNNWSTVAASNAATDDQFQLSIYVIGKGLLGVEGATPEQPPVDPEPEQPSTGVAELKTGDQVVIFAPAYNKALSATKTGNYNVGVDVTVADGVVSGFGETETFTVTVNADGTYSFANNGQNIGMADQYTSMNLGAVNDKWELTSLEGTLYNIKNTVRNTYMEWYAQYSNWSTYGASNAATDGQFQLSIYVIGKGLLGGESTEPETPPVTPDEPETPAGVTELKTGDQVVIFAPAYNKALSATKTGNYNVGVDVTVADGVVTGFGATETFTVTVNADGTYSFANNGQNIGMADQYTSMNLGAVNDKWELTSLEGTLFNIKNVVRGTYMEWYVQYSNWSTYGANNAATDDQFQLSIYVIDKGLLGGESTEPETPPVTPPAGDEDGTVLTIPEAVAMGSAMADKTFTTTKYKVTGVIDEIVKADYGNVYIKDAAGNRLYVYGIYDITGATRYDALDPKPVVGDTVTLLGVVGNYGGAQMKSGWLQELIPGTPVTPPVTPDEPVTPPATTGGSADFDTIQLPSNKQNGDSSYTATYTTAAGWTSTNSAIQCGGGTINPQFMVIGETNASKAVCMNGKVGASGSITSPTLNGGISKLTIKYTKMFTDTKLGATITVTEVATGNTQTHTISVELPKDEKQVIYTEEWTLETPVSGEFTIKIVNDCPSQNTGNKDRMTILNIDWEGVAPEEPETPPVVGGGAADFDTIELPSNKQNGDSSYTATYTTAAGWTSTNSAIQCGGGTINPQFMVIGETNASKAVCMNGKVGASGSITSPTLNGGISKLTIKYTKMFTDTKLGATITVTEKATGNTQTHTISVELPKDEKQTVYTEEWTLETPVSGEFTIKIVNDCPSQNTGNKDRMTVLSIVWEGAAAVHTHEYVTTTTATCTAAGTTTYTCSCGDTYSEDVEKLGHIDENLDIDCDRAGCTSKVAPAADSTLSVFTANNLGSKLSSSYSYYVEGTIVEVLDAKNGIFLISDGVGTETFYIRLPKNAEGVSHSSWQVKLVLGDKIKVYGKINKFTTSSAPNGSYYPASQGGVVTILEQHPHTFGDPTCTKPGYCECGQSGPAALNHIDANSDNACDRCSWNMKHAIEVLTTKCDDIKNTDKLDTTNGTATFESANFKATFAKGTGSFNTSGTDHMRFYKNNALTVESTGGKKIAGFAFVSSSDSYVDELEAVLTAAGYEYVKDGTKLTIMTSATESFNLPNSSTKNARIAAIEIIYEK